jgi:nucleotide-binding universal stress UspA family protein
MVPRDTQLVMEERGREVARESVARVIEAARKAQVRCEAVDVVDPSPANGILEAARRHDCDLIVMASHGKRGLAALGSQTMKAVAHTRVPVLVCR